MTRWDLITRLKHALDTYEQGALGHIDLIRVLETYIRILNEEHDKEEE